MMARRLRLAPWLAQAGTRHAPDLRRLPLPGGVRTLPEIALENAVEGCVRECWGALCAHYQAATAQSADVRTVWSTIADEETEHAQLSRDVASWLEAGLTAAERRQVEAACVAAISALRRELDRDLAPGLSEQLGLPERRAALQQFDELVSRVLTPARSV